ncbi:MAG: hypothetical protein ACRDVE_15305 [Actinocrinis sp.]
MAESTLAKLTAHFEQMMATVVEHAAFGGTKSGLLTGQSAARIAQAALGIVRQHDEERGAQFTREQLAKAIDQVRDAEFGDDGPPPFGYAADAGVLAGRLVEALAQNADMLRPGRAFHIDPRPQADPEPSAMAALVAVLEGIDDGTRERIFRWLIDRYGIA